MFHVFRLDNEGCPILLERYIDREDAAGAVDRYSYIYPNAHVDYVYKDTH